MGVGTANGEEHGGQVGGGEEERKDQLRGFLKKHSEQRAEPLLRGGCRAAGRRDCGGARAAASRGNNVAHRRLKDAGDAVLELGRALDVVDGAHLLGGRDALLATQRPWRAVSQIGLQTNQHVLCLRAVVLHLAPPLHLGVRQRQRRRHGNADEEYVCPRIAQRSQSVKVLLACAQSPKERERDT